VLILAMVGYGV